MDLIVLPDGTQIIIFLLAIGIVATLTYFFVAYFKSLPPSSPKPQCTTATDCLPYGFTCDTSVQKCFDKCTPENQAINCNTGYNCNSSTSQCETSSHI